MNANDVVVVANGTFEKPRSIQTKNGSFIKVTFGFHKGSFDVILPDSVPAPPVDKPVTAQFYGGVRAVPNNGFVNFHVQPYELKGVIKTS